MRDVLRLHVDGLLGGGDFERGEAGVLGFLRGFDLGLDPLGFGLHAEGGGTGDAEQVHGGHAGLFGEGLAAWKGSEGRDGDGEEGDAFHCIGRGVSIVRRFRRFHRGVANLPLEPRDSLRLA
jgi:hypothetical protein